jgi:hypothetical protein
VSRAAASYEAALAPPAQVTFNDTGNIMTDSVNNYLSVSPSDLHALVLKSYQLDKPLMIWGPPGV